jgi:hypothetical protein
MENNPLLDSDLSGESGLSLLPEARSFLYETSRWAKFLAILGFIGAGLLVLVGFFVMAAMGSMGSELSALGFPPAFLGFFYLVIAGIQVLPSLYLYNFSTKTRTALQSSDADELTNSLGNLKAFFKFYGVVAIVFIALYVLGFLFAIIFGATGLMGM